MCVRAAPAKRKRPDAEAEPERRVRQRVNEEGAASKKKTFDIKTSSVRVHSRMRECQWGEQCMRPLAPPVCVLECAYVCVCVCFAERRSRD